MSTAAHPTAILTLLLPLNSFNMTIDHTPPPMYNAAQPTALLTLLLPLNGFTMTILLLYCLMLLTLRPY
jgi:hypothetical protein